MELCVAVAKEGREFAQEHGRVGMEEEVVVKELVQEQERKERRKARSNSTFHDADCSHLHVILFAS